MKRKWISILLLILCLFTACSSAEKTAGTDELDHAASQLEQALPEGYEQTTQTEVYDFVFSSEGSELIYHLCITTYSNEEEQSIRGLNLSAISVVFDVQSTPMELEFEVSGHAAAIYQGQTCNYLCWTTSPKTSAVLEYDPDAISQEDAIRIVQSVYEAPGN